MTTTAPVHAGGAGRRVASFDNIETLPRFAERIAGLRPGKAAEVCVALRLALDC